MVNHEIAQMLVQAGRREQAQGRTTLGGKRVCLHQLTVNIKLQSKNNKRLSYCFSTKYLSLRPERRLRTEGKRNGLLQGTKTALPAGAPAAPLHYSYLTPEILHSD